MCACITSHFWLISIFNISSYSILQFRFLWFYIVSRIFSLSNSVEFSGSVNCVVVRIATREGVVCLYTKIKLQNTEKLAPIQSKNDVTWLEPIKLIGWLTILVQKGSKMVATDQSHYIYQNKNTTILKNS